MNTEPNNGPRSDRRHHAGVTPLFASIRVRDVHLDHRPTERGECIVDAPCVVRERAGIDDDGSGAGTRSVNGIDQLAFVVGLKIVERKTVGLCGRACDRDVIVERC